MSLTSVKMSEDVWLTCLTHALSTETEEIMGLLLGDIQLSKNGSATALIWGALPQPRSDRQKDRVETNPEQLTAASVHAENGNRDYNSSDWMDVRTQAMYQLLDSGFIGLIFSCFSEDAQKIGRIQVIAFQSLDGKQTMKPVSVTPVQKSPVIDIESSISSSDKSMGGGNMELDTGDSKTSGKSPRLGGYFVNDNSQTGNNNRANNSLGNAIQDLDPMDMSESMQEAMHLSNLEMSGAEYIRKEIPLLVVPTSSLLTLDSPLSSFTNLQNVMFEEERTAYNQAMAQNASKGKVHPLSFIHQTSTYKASMCKMIEYCLSPAMRALQDRLRENEIKLKLLAGEADVLQSELSKAGPSSSSPRSPSQGLRSSSFGHRDLYPVDSSPLKNVSGSRSSRR
ncbi:hypothetical protein CASFOL_038667 [Castilleja foliolosa]|uniref:BRCC36 C-terminal helical domain-containing protein n=1 Tax=Castilleja foliolosa TaxID=1961234 RepID=A0ABD3BML0_9LAMI